MSKWSGPEFPVGFRRFMRNRFLNFQLNRFYGLGYARAEDLQQAAARIRRVRDYVPEMKAIAAQAQADGRMANAASYTRAAEFLAAPGSADKAALYDQFCDQFAAAFSNDGIQRHLVPYGGGYLPVLELVPAGGGRDMTVVAFGGFDSLIEEFYGLWQWIAQRGYRVLAFEGPGQGGALRRHGLVFEHEWEKPTAAVLNHFGLDRVALIGMSMGGYWAIRAAAFEPRVARAIAAPPVYDWLEMTNSAMRGLVRAMMKWRWFTNAMVQLKMRGSVVIRHTMGQAMFISGGQRPIDGAEWMLAMNKERLHSDRVVCDVLLLGGERDAFQPPKLLLKQAAALTSARSVTSRIFTEAEGGDQHCQMGNVLLLLNAVVDWLGEAEIGSAARAAGGG